MSFTNIYWLTWHLLVALVFSNSEIELCVKASFPAAFFAIYLFCNIYLFRKKSLSRHFCCSILHYIYIAQILFHGYMPCCDFLYFLHFRFPLLNNTSLLQRLLFRKDGVLFKDVSTCCDGLLSTQRLFLLKTNCENSLLVNQSTDVKIDSITMKIYNQFCARDLGNIEK